MICVETIKVSCFYPLRIPFQFIIRKCSFVPNFSIMEERIKFLPVAAGQKEWRTPGLLPRNRNQSEHWKPGWQQGLRRAQRREPSLEVKEVTSLLRMNPAQLPIWNPDVFFGELNRLSAPSK